MHELPAHLLAFDNIMVAWNSAMATWNAKTVSLLYSEQALFIGSLPGLRQGRAGVCEYFSAIAGRSVDIQFTQKTLLSLSDDCFTVSGVALFVQDIDGAAPQLERRLSLVLKQVEKQWFIALHHVSSIPAVEGEFLY